MLLIDNTGDIFLALLNPLPLLLEPGHGLSQSIGNDDRKIIQHSIAKTLQLACPFVATLICFNEG